MASICTWKQANSAWSRKKEFSAVHQNNLPKNYQKSRVLYFVAAGRSNESQIAPLRACHLPVQTQLKQDAEGTTSRLTIYSAKQSVHRSSASFSCHQAQNHPRATSLSLARASSPKTGASAREQLMIFNPTLILTQPPGVKNYHLHSLREFVRGGGGAGSRELSQAP